MNPVSSHSGGPGAGPVYRRGFGLAADSPELRALAEREFPAAASELFDPVSRREFVRLMSASLALAGVGLTGCRRPVETIRPFSKMPEGYVHGVARYYASAMPRRGGAVPVLVRSNDGRPTKIEGNPEHPLNRIEDGAEGPVHGGTDLLAQASILDLYDPDRARRFTFNGETVARERVLDELARAGTALAGRQGEGLAILVDEVDSPTLERLRRELLAQWPKARWFVDEPLSPVGQRQGLKAAFGRPVRPLYRLERAKRILSLDADLVSGEDDAWRLIRGFAAARKVEGPEDEPARLYVVESLMTLTGSAADHRLRLAPSQIPALAAWLAAEVLAARGQGEAAGTLRSKAAGIPEEARKWATECAKDLAAHPGETVVLAGARQPAAVHFLAAALNVALEAVGKQVDYLPETRPEAGDLAALVDALNAGQVQTLVILGGNPGLTAPADLRWPEACRKAKQIFRLGAHEDETFPQCQWHLPAAHYLESWGDVRTADGTLTAVQPLIEPLFGGMTAIEVLARLMGREVVRPYDLVRETFRQQPLEGPFEDAWGRFLHDGFLAGSAARPVSVGPVDIAGKLPEVPAPADLKASHLDLVLYRDPKVDDGRAANNGWLQELPDPMTKITWDNVVLISRRTAQALDIEVVDENKNNLRVPVVRVEVDGRSVEGPVWIQPGLADHTVAIALGYGRARGGRIARGAGFDAYPLSARSARLGASGAKITKTGRTYPLSCTQNHWFMMGRPIIREANLEDYRKQPEFAKAMDLPDPPTTQPIYPNPLDKAAQKALHQWAMTVDLNRCVGCAACVIACQSENNVPIVGKDQVRRHREMHWLRIDRYFTGPVEDPQVINQPMMCQHCEAAPCENVCPVNATVHNEEGLNLMVYNRCVGTRYCSNNCPYKVRRFNFFDYNRRPLDRLYESPITSRTDGEWELKRWFKNPDRGSKPQDEWDLLKLARNPDVTVRMRGVMEKCTFCVQRIEQARIARKVQARDSGDIRVRDGEVLTACQQACPAEAIVFGNLKDPQSRVNRTRSADRGYTVLKYLGVKPRVTYLARIRNPNPAMPDYRKMPWSTEEFLEHGGALHGAHHEEGPASGETGAATETHGAEGGH